MRPHARLAWIAVMAAAAGTPAMAQLRPADPTPTTDFGKDLKVPKSVKQTPVCPSPSCIDIQNPPPSASAPGPGPKQMGTPKEQLEKLLKEREKSAIGRGGVSKPATKDAMGGTGTYREPQIRLVRPPVPMDAPPEPPPPPPPSPTPIQRSR